MSQENPCYITVVIAPNCKPSFRGGAFLTPGSHRNVVEVKPAPDQKKMVIIVKTYQLSKTPPDLETIGNEIRWIMSHIKGYCTQ